MAVRTEGAILPPSILQRIIGLDEKIGLRPEDFGLSGTRVREAASHAWNSLQGPWIAYKSKRQELGAEDTTFAATGAWVRQILRALDYGSTELLGRGMSVGEDGRFRVSALLVGHVPLYVVGHGQPLDRRPSSGGLTPHGNVQLLLNARDENLWGFVTNGLQWRILRDSVSLSRQAMVELDLEAIFEGGLYDEFLLFYLLCHESRLQAERPSGCWLERWSQTADEDGKRVLRDLSKSVRKSIEVVGQGFLLHPTNSVLRERLRTGALDKQDYYRQLLRLIYRMLFLFVAEDRGLLAAPESTEDQRRLYRDAYSTHRLRTLAGRLRGADRHHDLYIGLKLVLQALGHPQGCPELGIAPLGGLFKKVQTPDLDSAEISNLALLEAVRSLAVTREDGRRARVDYKNLGSEELGSVYESLLELHPELNSDGTKFELKKAGGNERKTSGSYYTPDSLIQCLLDTALNPVLEEAVRTARAKYKDTDFEPAAARAILDLRILDPAVGSGHFLIAAAHRMAKRLAQVRTGDEAPSPDEVRRAVRNVIGQCLYGVDINPMSAELCKVALWMEAMEPGKPLAFLDRHIQVGNSLLGATPDLIKEGIPDAAYDAVSDPVRRADLKRRNRREREGARSLFPRGLEEGASEIVRRLVQIDSGPDDALSQVEDKERRYYDLTRDREFENSFIAADLWSAAFSPTAYDAFAAAIAGVDLTTEAVLRADELGEDTLAVVRQLREQFRFFHFHLAFREVFERRGGFDVVLGNPPWERVKLQEKEFFAERAPDIADAPNAAARGRLIQAERKKDSELWREFKAARDQADAEARMLTKSGRYPLAGRGDVNTYAVFTELFRSLLNPFGRAGIIVPTGIATDDTTKFFFQDLVERRSLHSYFGFKNERFLFPKPVEHTVTFGLLTMLGTNLRSDQMEFTWLCWTVEDMQDPERRIALSTQDIALMNPNTGTCPVFRTRRDAEITKAVYRRVPVLIREDDPDVNPWRISFQRMFDMATDSGLFRTREEMESAQGCLEGNNWIVPETTSLNGREISKGRWLPLYEAKMIHQYDHRWASYTVVTTAKGKKSIGEVEARDAAVDQKQDANFVVQPKYWVPETSVNTADPRGRAWYIGWRDICRSTDIRTIISAVIPKCGVGDKYLLAHSHTNAVYVACLRAVLSSFVLDYTARQKIGGTSMKYFTFKQLPILPPSAMAIECPWDRSVQLTQWITPRVLELSYTAHDLAAFARDLGYDGPPFSWDEERRILLRSELDAAFFHLYGIGRDDVEYIMDTFHVVRDNDLKTYSRYLTKETILEIYDEMAAAMSPAQITVPQPIPEVIVPALFPSTEKDKAVCGLLYSVVEQGNEIRDEQALLATLLALRPGLCRHFLSAEDRREYESYLASGLRPSVLAQEARFAWDDVRRYLEQTGAVRIDRGGRESRLRRSGPPAALFNEYALSYASDATFALAALERSRELLPSAPAAMGAAWNALLEVAAASRGEP